MLLRVESLGRIQHGTERFDEARGVGQVQLVRVFCRERHPHEAHLRCDARAGDALQELFAGLTRLDNDEDDREALDEICVTLFVPATRRARYTPG